jgi:hypothetical protein
MPQDIDFKIGTAEERREQAEALKEAGRFPEEDELIVLPGGKILLDVEGPLDEEELGDAVGGPMLCG